MAIPDDLPSPAERPAARVPRFQSPVTHAPLLPGADGVTLIDASDGAIFPVENGIADLVYPRRDAASVQNPQFDRPFTEVIEAALKWTFAAYGGDEATLRGKVVDKLDLAPNAVVLDVACGFGATTGILQQRLPQGVLCNTDISMELLATGARRFEGVKTTCQTLWCAADALNLPFADGSFDAVISIGGFNQFGNPARAMAEITRVGRVGGQIVVVDESYAPWLRHTLTGQMVMNDNPLMAYDAPLAFLPVVAQDVRVEWLLGNAFYCIDFRVGETAPVVNIDLPHEGLRGGTIRSRYEAAQQRRAAESDQ